MTTEHEASRTLVKSPPELWAECSDPGALARHLGEFGEITITRLEPESAVAWEGEHASGTVRIEPSGWGTRVTLTAETKGEAAVGWTEEPVQETAAEPVVQLEPVTEPPEESNDATLEEAMEAPEDGRVENTGRARARWRRITARMRRAFTARDPDEALEEGAPPGLDEPEEPLDSIPPLKAPPEVGVDPDPETVDPPAPPSLDPEAILSSALESLGQAHHRPFSRA